MNFQKGELVGGKYRLERALARGGMGEVWIARHVELDVDVAVKFMMVDAAEGKAGARFRVEARAAAQLKTPHVVRVYDYGTHSGSPYLAMELLDGEDLQARIDREGKLAPEVALGIAEQACKALAIAHSAGIVHRDIKPSNLFLAREGGDEVLKVLDFGIAKQAQPDGAITSQGVLLGSPAYMSPEQARGHDVDLRSDLWSFAVVLYELLTGDSPFSGATVGDAIAKICWEPLPQITVARPDLPPRYSAFFERSLARDRRERYPSADDLLNEFRAVVTGEAAGPAPALTSERVAPASTLEVSSGEFGRYDETVAAPAPLVDRQDGASLVGSSVAVRTTSSRRWVWPAAVVFALGGLAAAALIVSRRPGAEVAGEPAAQSASNAPLAAEPALPPSSLASDEVEVAPADVATAPSATASSGPAPALPKAQGGATKAPPSAPAKAPKSPSSGQKAPKPAGPVDNTFGI